MDFAWLGLQRLSRGERWHDCLFVNFARDVVDAADPRRLALVAVSRDGERREIAFGEVADRSARLAGTLAARGVGARRRRHDADRQPARVGLRDGRLLAARRRGPALHRAAAAGRPAGAHGRRSARRAIVADARNVDLARRGGLRRAACWWSPTSACSRPSPAPAAELEPERPGADRVHVGHGRRAQADPPRRALPGRPARPGRALVRRARRATCAGAPRRAAGRCRHATPSSPPGCAARRRCCTTPASTPTSGSTCSSARA